MNVLSDALNDFSQEVQEALSENHDPDDAEKAIEDLIMEYVERIKREADGGYFI